MSIKKGKIKKNLGIGCLIASAFFLFNPDIAIIDVIPDVFGYLFLVAGLTQLSEVNDKIEEARNCFKKAAICNALKLGLILILFGMVTQREMPVTLLLFTFVMNIFDLIYVLPGYLHLFDGLIYLGERLDGGFVLGRRKFVPRECPVSLTEKEREAFERREHRRRLKCERALSNTEKFKRATLIFVLFKAVTPVLPELTSLFDDGYNGSPVNYYDFIYLFRSFAVILMFAVGIIWLVSAVVYYSRLIRDRVFISAIKEKYSEEVLPKRVHFAKKFVCRERTLFICATFLMTNLYFDEYNILPSFIAAILLAFAAFGIREYSTKWKFCFWGSVFMVLSSALLEISRASFNSEYIKEQIMRNPEAYSAWELMLAISIVEFIAAVLVIISVLLVAGDIAKKYTGYFTQRGDSFDPERATKELHSELTRPLIITGIFGILSAACVPFYFIAMPMRIEAVWFFEIVLSLIFACCFMQNLLDITKNINYSHFVGDE